ncbi:MAG TPA: hypothetical protein VIM14_07995, partial [Polyangia bacterium]
MMPIPVSCPDDRMALARRGALSPTEWQVFATHLSECRDCRIAWRLAGDFDRDAPTTPGDERLIARGVKKALASSARPRSTLVRVAVAAAATIVAAGVASGAMVLRARYAGVAIHAEDNAKTRNPKVLHGAGSIQVTPPATPAGAAEGVVESAAEKQPGTATTATPNAQRIVNASGTARTVARPAKQTASLATSNASPREVLAPPPHQEDAASLFTLAVAERQQGRPQTAIAGFRALQRRFPESREAAVSLVSLGDLLLGAGGPADALLVFETYLL